MTKTEKSFFKAAKAMSELSDHQQHKHGAVVVDKHRVISSGYNSLTKCNSLQAKIDEKRFGVPCRGCVHAEVSALLPLIKNGVDLRRASIFVYREHKDHSLAMSRPCPGCMGLIKSLGLKKIYYTVENGYAEEIVNEL